MNKSKIIQDIANHLKEITVGLETLIGVLDETVENDDSKEKTVTLAVTLEQVRAVLATKSQAGKQLEVKALITKHNGKKLTDLDPSCYEELLKEAEVL